MPDDQRVFVTLGCAAENARHAASAFGMNTSYMDDETDHANRLIVEPMATDSRDQISQLFDAIPHLQSTGDVFDRQPLTNEELVLL